MTLKSQALKNVCFEGVLDSLDENHLVYTSLVQATAFNLAATHSLNTLTTKYYLSKIRHTI